MHLPNIVLGICCLLPYQGSVSAQTTSSYMENVKEIATRFYSEVINKGDTETLKQLMADDFIDHYAPPTQPRGIPGFIQFLTMVTTGFPDLQASVDDMLIEGDKVVVRLTITGTQTGVLLGNIPPSGKKATWSGIDILQITHGKIRERWSLRDMLGMMRQIGVVK